MRSPSCAALAAADGLGNAWLRPTNSVRAIAECEAAGTAARNRMANRSRCGMASGSAATDHLPVALQRLHRAGKLIAAQHRFGRGLVDHEHRSPCPVVAEAIVLDGDFPRLLGDAL